MKAIIVNGEPGQPELVWAEAPDPDYGPDEVLVQVQATAVNRADLAQARGNYPPPPGVTDILGLEMAGVITAVGGQVANWRPGDQVCALLPGGGYAELVSVHHSLLMPVPNGWDFAQAAGVPEVWLTAFVNLFLEGGLQAGETVLIHAGASGVGTAAIQLAARAGATVFTTAGSDKKTAVCRELGASLAINYKNGDFLDAVLTATDGRGVNLILDPVGGNYLGRNVPALAEYGRLINIGLLGGVQGELNMGLLLRRSLRLVGSRLRVRPLAEKSAITRQFQERFWPLLADGTLRPIIDRHFPLPDAQAAHAYVAQNKNIGKVILVV